MDRNQIQIDSPEATQSTRREAVAIGGGLALSALLAAAMGARTVSAQEASPEASPAAGDGFLGQYVGVRLRTFKAEQDIDEATAIIAADFVPLMEGVPGFVTYFGSADPATRSGIYIGVFADKAGADESNRRAAEWLADNGYDWFEGDPTIFEGPIGVASDA